MKKAEFERYWRQAIHTFQSACRDLEEGDLDWAAFKFQQSAELAVKGWIRSTIHFVTGHSIIRMLREEALEPAPDDEILKCAEELDRIYIPSRYPDAYPDGSPMDYFREENVERLKGCAESILVFVATGTGYGFPG